MAEPRPISPDQQVVDAMLQLTRASASQRLIAAGSDAFDLYLDLLQRGFSRVATTATCRIPCGQHDVALIAGNHSIQALEALLARLIPFLNTSAVVALRIDANENRLGGKVQSLLERLGFRVEAGTRCERGFVLSARRRACSHFAKAA
jgi:hypothetical protein